MGKILVLLAIVGFLFLLVQYGPDVINFINGLRGVQVNVR